jgi:hypothetical protein
MGFMFAYSACVDCGQMFTYNPERVPSVRVNAQRQPDPNGSREPICEACVNRWNVIRKEHGLPPIQILPNAYGAEECV